MLCRHCARPFVCQQCFRSHEEGCVEELVTRVSNRKTDVLCPVVDLAQDQVYSSASLRIGQGNLFRGQERKEMFFPTTIKFFPTPRDVTVVTQIKMVSTFKDKDEDSEYSLRLVLSESQIKTWFSSESGRRKKAAVNRVFEKGFTELSQSIDLQDNQEGGHDLNGGVVEDGGPPPPPLPPPPPPPPSPL
jgi:hypothetical protein